MQAFCRSAGCQIRRTPGARWILREDLETLSKQTTLKLQLSVALSAGNSISAILYSHFRSSMLHLARSAGGKVVVQRRKFGSSCGEWRAIDCSTRSSIWEPEVISACDTATYLSSHCDTRMPFQCSVHSSMRTGIADSDERSPDRECWHRPGRRKTDRYLRQVCRYP